MAKERESSFAKHKRDSYSESEPKRKSKSKRKRSSSSDDGSPERKSPPKKSPKKNMSWSAQTTSDPDVTVHLRNADMFSRYRTRNPHIAISRPNTTTSNFLPSQLTEDDEVWLFEVPNDINVNDLAGQSFKLGSKSSTLQTENFAVECATEKYSDLKSETLICQDKNAQLVVKNITPVGRVILRKKIEDNTDVPLDSKDFTFRTKVPFPSNLKVRHPIHGANFEDSIDLDESTRGRLQQAQSATMHKLKKRVKQEPDADDYDGSASPLKKRKRHYTEIEDTIANTIKTENINDNEELAWISQI